MQGYPWLWHDFQPDTGDGQARSDEGLVNDPHRTGIKGYIVNKSRNISLDGLLLLRSAYWTVTVSDSENFSATNIKIVNRKQQYHDDAFDFTGNSRHILVQDSFAMTTDDTFAFYGGPRATIEDVVAQRVCELHLHVRAGHRIRRGTVNQAPALRRCALHLEPE